MRHTVSYSLNFVKSFSVRRRLAGVGENVGFEIGSDVGGCWFPLGAEYSTFVNSNCKIRVHNLSLPQTDFSTVKKKTSTAAKLSPLNSVGTLSPVNTKLNPSEERINISCVGYVVGWLVGKLDGCELGNIVGCILGCIDGRELGNPDGFIVGCADGDVGFCVGCPEGLIEGRELGCEVGFIDGCPVGLVGCCVGWPEGKEVGG